MSTVADYIREAEAFPYSIDNFLMEKDLLDLNLMNVYLESKEFLEENQEFSYIFKEAYDDKFTDTSEKDFWDKLFNAFVRILKWLLKPFNAIYAFLKSFFDKERIEEEKLAKMEADLVKYIKIDPPVKKVEAMMLPDEEVSKPLLDTLQDFKNKHSQLWKDVLEGKLYGEIGNVRNIQNSKFRDKEVLIWIKRIGKYSHIGNEEQKFLENLYPAIHIKRYEVPNFFATIYENKDTLMEFIRVMKKVFSKERVKKPIYTAKDIRIMTDRLREEHDSKGTYLLHLNKAQEFCDVFKPILRGLKEVVEIVDKFVHDEEKLVENTEKQKQGFIDLLAETRKLVGVLNDHTPHAVNKLVTHKNNIYAMQNLWKKIIPMIKAIEENVRKNKKVDTLDDNDQKL